MKLVELLIEMKANTGALEKGLEHAGKKVDQFATHTRVTVEGLRGNLAELGLAFAGLSIGAAVKELVDFNDQMAHMAQATGMGIENFSALTYALKPFDIQIAQVSEAFAYFDKILSGLVRSKAGVLAIQQLGLSLKELQGMDPHAALLKVADAFSKLKDGSQKAGISAALFTNTVGFEMIPFLDQGSAGIAALETQAKRLGVTLSEDDVKATDQAKLALVELEGAFRGVEESIARHAYPALSEWIQGLMGSELNAHAALDRLKLDAIGFGSVVADAFGVGFIPGVQEKMAKAAQDISDDLTRTEQKIKAGIAMPKPGSGGDLAMPGLKTAKQHVDAVKNALRSLRDELVGFSQGDVAKGLQHLKEIGASPAQLEQGRALLEQIAQLKDEKKAQQEYNSALGQYRSLLAELQPELTGVDKIHEEYAKTLGKLIALQTKGVDVGQGFVLAAKKQSDEMSAAIQNSMNIHFTMPNLGGAGVIGSDWKNTPSYKLLDGMTEKAKELGQEMSHSFTRMIETGQGFRQMLGDTLRLFETFLLKTIVFKSLSNSLSGSGGIGGLIGSFLGGISGKASGGPVTAGSLYMVGEEGPELFAPGMSGSIIPSGGMSSGRSGDNINIDARGAAPGVEHRIMRAMAAMQKRSTSQSLAATYEYKARGGIL